MDSSVISKGNLTPTPMDTLSLCREGDSMLVLGTFPAPPCPKKESHRSGSLYFGTLSETQTAFNPGYCVKIFRLLF
jgi:hypothetical protein